MSSSPYREPGEPPSAIPQGPVHDRLLESALARSASGSPLAEFCIVHPADYASLVVEVGSRRVEGFKQLSFFTPWGEVQILKDRYAPRGTFNWVEKLPERAPLRFALGRPRDPEPLDELELTASSLTAIEEAIASLRTAQNKLMLGHANVTITLKGRKEQ